MKFFMVSKTKRNLDLLTEENILKSSVRRGINYDIIDEKEWETVKDDFDLEIECNTIYKCTIHFLDDAEVMHKSINNHMHKELNLSPPTNDHQNNSVNNNVSVDINNNMNNNLSVDINNNTIDTIDNVNNTIDTIDINNNVNNTNNVNNMNNTISTTNNTGAVKTVMVFGLEIIFDSICSLFISPMISYEKFTNSFTVIFEGKEINPGNVFDALVDESMQEIVLYVKRKQNDNIVLSTSATAETDVLAPRYCPPSVSMNILKCSGLSNLGNTCYMNSSLQCLFNLQSLTNSLIYTKKFKNTKYKKVLLEYKNLLLTLLMNGNISAKRLRNQLISLNSDFNNFEEQDAQEFLSCLLDMMHEGTITKEYDSINKVSLISELFFGKTRTKIRCIDCKAEVEKKDSFALISLPIPAGLKNIFVSGTRISTMKVREGISKGEIEERLKVLTGKLSPVIILEYSNNNYLRPYTKNTLNFVPATDFVVYECFPDRKYVFVKLFMRTFFFLFTKHPYDLLIDISDIKETKADSLIGIYYNQIIEKIYERLKSFMKNSVDLTTFTLNVKLKAGQSVVVNETTFVGLELFFYRHFELFGNRLIPSSNISLYDCLFKFIEQETIDYSCSNKGCGKVKSQALISTDFISLPKYLVLHLKRFNYTGTKITTFVDFDQEIFLESKEGRKSYSLVAVICHFKVGIWYGHYAAYVLKANKWFCCNDNVISRLDVDKKNAYILFYEEK